MNSDSEIFTSSYKIKCHSSKQLFCRGDLCFIEYDEISPNKIEYGCIIFDKNIDYKCNKTIDFIYRECCSITFCNSRLFNHNNHWSILNISSINNNDLFHIRLQIILNIIMAILFFSLLCAIIIYLWKQRIEQIGQRTIRSRKLQPSLSPTISINAPTIPSLIDGDNNIIHISPYSDDLPLNLISYNNNKPSDLI